MHITAVEIVIVENVSCLKLLNFATASDLMR
jgi:hypothetical protein